MTGQKPHIAIVGSGISAITAAWYLHPHCRLTIFEKNDYTGGHTHTHSIGGQNVDTGFIVLNRVTYPNLLNLFEKLQVSIRPSDMSFGVHHHPDNYQWAGHNAASFFAMPGSIFRPRSWRFLSQIRKFNRLGEQVLRENKDQGGLTEWLNRNGFNRNFVQWYLYPMASAVWSTPFTDLDRFPVLTLLQFFKNHGFLGIDTHYQWYTVEGGSRSYIDAFLKKTGLTVNHNSAVNRIEITGPDSRRVRLSINGQASEFDGVVCAAHSDQAWQMLGSGPYAFLKDFNYTANRVVLHSDESVLPGLHRARASWNFIVDHDKEGRQATTTIYDMNRLQGIDPNRRFLVSVNPLKLPIGALRNLDYAHPAFTTLTRAGQLKLHSFTPEGPANQGSLEDALSDDPAAKGSYPAGPVALAGAWMRYGFHEDGCVSGMHAAARMLKFLRLDKAAADVAGTYRGYNL